MGISEKVVPVTASLIERAAEIYDFGHRLRGPSGIEPAQAPRTPVPERPAPALRIRHDAITNALRVDRSRLRDLGFIVPGNMPGPLAEEFRIVKRQLLLNASGAASGKPLDRGRMILMCSAQANEGKTFCAINLALSLASERDTEVLLVDADVAKPDVLSLLGLESGPGLMDALADPQINIESLILRTDIEKLSVLGAGRQASNDTEVLASSRTQAVLDGLATANPTRIVIFDSAPALAASPASVLALNVGQVVMVVRADRTTESALRDAVALVGGCPNISLLLNGSSFLGGNQKFGSYYGQDK